MPFFPVVCNPFFFFFLSLIRARRGNKKNNFSGLCSLLLFLLIILFLPNSEAERCSSLPVSALLEWLVFKVMLAILETGQHKSVAEVSKGPGAH